MKKKRHFFYRKCQRKGKTEPGSNIHEGKRLNNQEKKGKGIGKGNRGNTGAKEVFPLTVGFRDRKYRA